MAPVRIVKHRRQVNVWNLWSSLAPWLNCTWSQRAAHTSTSIITPTGVYKRKHKQTNRQTRKKVIPQSNTLRKLNTVIYYRVTSEAIFGDRDRKRELFLALEMTQRYFYFLEQIAPSCAVHARTRGEDFRRCSANNWQPKFSKCLMFLVHNSIRSWLLEYCSCHRLLQLEWIKTVSN